MSLFYFICLLMRCLAIVQPSFDGCRETGTEWDASCIIFILTAGVTAGAT